MQSIKKYVTENSTLLFSHLENNTRIALFDNKGFSFSSNTQNRYNQIKNEPHLYVAFTNNENGFFYIGKSFQKGGRWKRQHAYHLGTLAHHLLNTIRYDDQNHEHWIEHWMNRKTIKNIVGNKFSVELKEEVFITFIACTLFVVKEYLPYSAR